MTSLTKAAIDWLCDSDPALRWQVQRDLLGEPEEVWQATRARIATEGFGAAIAGSADGGCDRRHERVRSAVSRGTTRSDHRHTAATASATSVASW